jgi:hypothetical protein
MRPEGLPLCHELVRLGSGRAPVVGVTSLRSDTDRSAMPSVTRNSPVGVRSSVTSTAVSGP